MPEDALLFLCTANVQSIFRHDKYLARCATKAGQTHVKFPCKTVAVIVPYTWKIKWLDRFL